MGLDLLTKLSSARPVIFAEGFFISCHLEEGQIVPEEGIQQPELLSILSGDVCKSDTDFVDKCTVSLYHLGLGLFV